VCQQIKQALKDARNLNERIQALDRSEERLLASVSSGEPLDDRRDFRQP
jgi:hypothetical protein